MTLKQLLIIVIGATAACWISWWFIVIQTDPTTAGSLDFVLFYLSLLFSLIGTFFIISFVWRKIFFKQSLDYKIVGSSFRQSIFFSLMVTGMLILQSRRLLTWWNLTIIIVGLTLVEAFILSVRKSKI